MNQEASGDRSLASRLTEDQKKGKKNTVKKKPSGVYGTP